MKALYVLLVALGSMVLMMVLQPHTPCRKGDIIAGCRLSPFPPFARAVPSDEIFRSSIPGTFEDNGCVNRMTTSKVNKHLPNDDKQVVPDNKPAARYTGPEVEPGVFVFCLLAGEHP